MQIPPDSSDMQAQEPIEPTPAPTAKPVLRAGVFIRILAVILVLGILLGALFVFLASRHPLPILTRHPISGRGWMATPSPNQGTIRNGLNAVAALSANNIWAVGFSFGTPNGYTQEPLIEHWDGSRWSIIQNPNPGGPYNNLTGVAAASSSDIWAVGWSNISSFTSHAEQTLIEHWDGSRWNIIQSPNYASANNNVLSQVVVASDTDVWAVGSSPLSYPEYGPALIEHWNGSQWSIVQVRNPGQVHNNYLTSVALVPGSHQLWAVGYTGSGDPESTLTEIWNP
jgi:hypothetical protein